MKIDDFLVNLSIDPEALARFRRDPEVAMAEAGLSEAERQAIREGDLRNVIPVIPTYAGVEYSIDTCEARGGAPILSTGSPLGKEGLTVVGLGIRSLQMTPEARVCIAQASKVLFLVADPISEGLIRKLNSTAESLEGFYETGKPRIEIYDAMVNKILSCLEGGRDVCAVFYGHAGVLGYPPREALRRARLKGVSGRMLPGISALDNLIADLQIDAAGLQSYEATAFLIYRYRFDTSAGLVLWQVGVLGETRWDPPHKAVPPRLKVLVDYLAEFYGRDHEVYLYRAAQVPSAPATTERLSLGDLPGAKLIEGGTLYVPPKQPPKVDSDMAKKLGMG